MIFVDTNYFLRFFIGQPQDQHLEAKALFHKGALGDVELCTSLVVFFEVYWVATSFYAFKREKVTSFLRNMLTMEFIRLENRDILADAVSTYEKTSFDLEDAYNLAYAHSVQVKDFATYDKQLKKKFQSL